MALAIAKKNWYKIKQRACFKNAKSFARVDYNRKAIAVRGWYPLTRNLLDHPEIAASEDPSSISDSGNESQSTSDNQHSVAAMLNYQSGLANTVISDILQNIDREAVRQNIRANQDEGRQATVAFAEAKKLTAGVVFKSGRAWLGPEVLQAAVENKRKRDEIEQGVAERQNTAQNKKKEAFDKAWSEVAHLPTSLWSVQQLKALVSYKETESDRWPKLKNKAQLLEKWEEVKSCGIPHLPSAAELQQTATEQSVKNES